MLNVVGGLLLSSTPCAKVAGTTVLAGIVVGAIFGTLYESARRVVVVGCPMGVVSLFALLVLLLLCCRSSLEPVVSMVDRASNPDNVLKYNCATE